MITIDEKGLAEAQKLLADMPKAIPKAAARAINRAAAAAKKAARSLCIHSESIDKRSEKRYLRHMIFRCPDGGK